MILASAIYKLLLAATVTGWVLVDDAYITLRYARNMVEHGQFVFNLDEPVFGVTTPLWALLTTVLYSLFGESVEVAVTVTNVTLWSLSAWMVARSCSASSRLCVTALFLFLPNLVDNQFLGMETALFVWLMLGAVRAGSMGHLTRASAFVGLLLITRPEGVLLAAVLLGGLILRDGLKEGRRKLVRPAALFLMLFPGVAWTVFASGAYGSPIPHSMIAKSGWASDHYASLFSPESILLAIPRLTFLPFIDYLPGLATVVLTLTLLVGILWVIWKTFARGAAENRIWLSFYCTYIAFYVLGKGATEASWYSVPPSVALLLAAGPLLPAWVEKPRWSWAIALVLAALSIPAVSRRSALLNLYVDGYGQCSQELNSLPDAQPPPEHPVLIGEIGVFGFQSRHPVVDVGALVSPEILPMKNARYSFLRMAAESGAHFFVISERAIEANSYPTVGYVWANEQEAAWFARNCRLVTQHLDKRVYRVAHGTSFPTGTTTRQ